MLLTPMRSNDVPTIEPEAVPRVMWIMWGAFVFATGAYLVIAPKVTQLIANRPPLFEHYALYYNPGLIIIAVAALVIGWVMERSRLSPARLEQAKKQQGCIGVLGAYRGSLIVQLAVYESVAIFGLFYFLSGGPYVRFAHFCIVSWALMGILAVKLPGYIAAIRQAVEEDNNDQLM